MLVCSPAIRTIARSGPAYTVTIMSSTQSDRSGLTSVRVRVIYGPRFSLVSSVIREMTSRPALSSPPRAPMQAAAAMPRRPPVFGTTTLLTFLMMLPLASTTILSGSFPRAALAEAAQYARAIGSVHPIALISSRRRIST